MNLATLYTIVPFRVHGSGTIIAIRTLLVNQDVQALLRVVRLQLLVGNDFCFGHGEDEGFSMSGVMSRLG